jgi:hypothetical protein
MRARKIHTKPDAPQQAIEAEKVARQMYSSLMLKTAPKATPQGYVAGGCIVLKMLIDQASEQGADKEMLKHFIIDFTNNI